MEDYWSERKSIEEEGSQGGNVSPLERRSMDGTYVGYQRGKRAWGGQAWGGQASHAFYHSLQWGQPYYYLII